MSFNNVGELDRVIRIFTGAALGYGAWITWPASVVSEPGAVSLVLLVAGAVALVTGMAGWCPVYAVFNYSTNTRTKA